MNREIPDAENDIVARPPLTRPVLVFVLRFVLGFAFGADRNQAMSRVKAFMLEG